MGLRAKVINFKQMAVTTLFVFSIVVAQFANIPFASAATLTWDGSAGDGKFSTAANWSTDSAPVDGDILTFNASVLSAQATLDNDIVGLSVAGISFTGTPSGYYSFAITGNELTVSGAITNNSTYNSEVITQNLGLDIVLGSDVTISNVSISGADKKITMGSYSLSVSATASCGVAIGNNLIGSGALNLGANYAGVTGNNAAYTGTINITAGSVVVAHDSFGSSAAGTVVSGAGSLSIYTEGSVSIAEPLTLSGSGSLRSQSASTGFCSGSTVPINTTTLTGAVTLQSDFKFNSSNNVVITGAYTANGHTFAVQSGSNGTLTTPQGEIKVPAETIVEDGDKPTEYIFAGNKQTIVLSGTRDGATVDTGGIIKGTGTLNTLYINEGGIVAPGNSPGTMTVLESFNLTGTYQAELLNKDTYDQLVVGENYTGGGNAVVLNSESILDLVLYDGYSIKKGDAFTLIDNLSDTDVSGTFEGLAEGTQFTVDSIIFSISYVGGDGNDIVITALNTGSDPNAPNTGFVGSVAAANPAVVAGLGILTVIVLAAAMRRRSNN